MSDENSLIKVDDLAGLAKPANTLIKKISKAIGGVYEPHHLRRVALAKADAAIIEGRARAHVRIIEANAEIAVSELQSRATNRLIAEEVQRQRNIEAITRQAIPELAGDAEPERMDDDWITNLFNQCRPVSNEQMQSLWAKVLAGEANSPGAFSKRTVNTVAGLDLAEATLFTQLCGFMFTVGQPTPLILDVQGAIYANVGLHLGTLSLLETAGLIHMTGAFDYVKTKMPKKMAISYFGRRFQIEFAQPEQEIKEMGKSETQGENQNSYQLHIGCAIFSSSGMELARISGAQPQEGAVEFVREFWKKYGIKMMEDV